MTRDIFKTILLLCALLCFIFAISSCGEEPRSTHPAQQDIDTLAYSMPQALRVVPGTSWARWNSGDSILLNGFALMSQDAGNSKERIVTDSAVLAWLVGVLPDSLALSGYADTLRLSNDTLYISGNNYVLLSSYLDNTDSQTLASTSIGDSLTVSGGNSILIPHRLYGVDSLAEIYTKSFPLGATILHRANMALYKVQASAVSGYTTDSIAVIPTGGRYAVLQPIRNQYEVEWFGAVGDGVTDDADYFENAINYTVKTGGNGIVLDPKSYFFSRAVFSDTINADFSIVGNGAKLISDEKTLFYFDNNYTAKTLNGNHSRGDLTITLNESLSDVNIGDIIHISSNTDVETGFDYDENDVSKITAKSGSTVTISKPLNFSYQPGSETVTVHIFRNKNVNICDLVLNSSSIKGERISLHVDNIKAFNESPGATFDFFSFNKGYNSRFQNIDFSGCRYGLLINRQSNVVIDGVTGEDCTHPISIGTFCDNVSINNFKYYDCTTDAHPAFNVSYTNGEIWADNINVRALGVTIRNVMVHPDTSTVENSTGSPIGIQSLVSEYQFLLKEYRTVIDRLHFVDKLDLSDPRGLALNEISTAEISNSTISYLYLGQQSTTPDPVKFKISNSTIGGFRTYKYSNIDIYNCVFDANLNIDALPYIYEGTVSGGGSTGYINIYSSQFIGVSGDTTAFVNESRNNDNYNFNNVTFIDIDRFAHTVVHSSGYGDSDVLASQLITNDTFPSVFFANEGHVFLNSIIHDSLFIIDNDNAGLTILNDTLKIGDGAGNPGILFDIADTETGNITWKDNTGRWWKIYNGGTSSRDLIFATSSDDTEIDFVVNGVQGLQIDKSGSSASVAIGTSGAANTIFTMNSANASINWQVSSTSGGIFFNSSNRQTFRESGTNHELVRIEQDGDFILHDDGGVQALKWSGATKELTVNSVTDQGDYKLQVTGNSYFSGNLNAASLPTYADDTAAGSGGLVAGDIYKTATGELRVKL